MHLPRYIQVITSLHFNLSKISVLLWRYVIYQQLSSLFLFTGALSEDNISLRSSPSKAYKPKTSNIQEEYPAEEYPEVDSDGEILDVPDSAYVDALKSEESELTKNNSFR